MNLNKKYLITGSQGQLANEFVKSLGQKSCVFTACSRKDFDLTDLDGVSSRIETIKPDVILNCAAYNYVDKAEEESQLAQAVNADGVKHLAECCKDQGILLVHFSTDFVFDGTKTIAYTEEDTPNPVNVYGKSKWDGEKAIQSVLDQYLIFRVSWVFGDGKQNFLFKLKQWAMDTPTLRIVNDEMSVPTSTKDIVDVVLLALEQGLRGLYHLTSGSQASRYDVAKYYFGITSSICEVLPVSSEEFVAKAKRPMYSVMSNKKIAVALNVTLPTWQEAVKRFVNAQEINQTSTF